jgi:hypothetical protein
MLTSSRNSTSKIFYLFLFLLTVINLFQAGLTSLNNDEAYYWMYSKYLDWGYFDHPPMIALMIKAGYSVFHNELGVRLLTVLSMTASITLIWSIVDKESGWKKDKIIYFFMLVLILPVFNIYGFIATPDSPLIFFSLLFLFAYKRFLNNNSWKNTIFTGISMAALMYSKYHAALLIILVIISNLSLFKSLRFYLAAILALLLFVPHIYWQYINDFPSFKYHLVERVSGLDFGNIPEYLGNILIFHNPVILPLCIWLFVKCRPADKFDRALYFIFFGFLIFFLIASFRYRVQPQWTVLIAIPIIIILFRNIDSNQVIRKTIKWITLIMIPILIIGRAALVFDFLPVAFLKDEFHDYEKKVKEISLIAGDLPVVFTNSYQDPSVYTFYTGKFAHSLNNLNYRKTQYDIWNFEEQLHGREILYVPHWPTNFIQENFEIHTLFNGDTLYSKVYSNFQSLQKECVILKDEKYSFRKNSNNTIKLDFFNPYPYVIDIRHKELPVVFQIGFFKNGKREERWNLQLPDTVSQLIPGNTITLDCKFDLGELSDTSYRIVICSETGVLYDTFNSRFREATINK